MNRLATRPLNWMTGKVLNKETINQNLVRAQYAVRGELAIRAEELRLVSQTLLFMVKELKRNPNSLPFDKVVFCNIGNPQQLGQNPVTYFRQIMSLVEWPELLGRKKELLDIYPSDVLDRAERIVTSIGSVGAYSHSQGIPSIRETIAKYIERRDGVPAQSNSIFLTNGASDAVTRVLECIITAKNIGVMIPIPQYPLYSAVISLLDGSSVPYFLDESSNWSLKVSELERSLNEARLQNIEVRAICIINPGNPTGNCFTHETLKEIVAFCKKNRLILLADEVYQMNIYGENPFISARQIASSMGEAGDIEVVSFNSISKGLVGECGHRGGYYECYNMDPFVIEQFYKQASICLCANVTGQILMSLALDPPQKGEPSYGRYEKETKDIWESLKRRAQMLRTALVGMTDVSCNVAAGAMYLFPKIAFPPRLIEHTRLLDKQADEVYAMELLNATGIVLEVFWLFNHVVCGARKRVWAGSRDLSYKNYLSSERI